MTTQTAKKGLKEIDQLLKNIQESEILEEEREGERTRMEQAKIYTAKSYAIFSLLHIYYKLNGLETDHLNPYLKRVKLSIDKIKGLKRKNVIDSAAAARFIKHSLPSNESSPKSDLTNGNSSKKQKTL